MRYFAFSLACLFMGMQSDVAQASGPEIINVKIQKQAATANHDFHVTVRHDDSGWDHYADRFEILGSDGAVLGVRILAHPHVAEQPFTRSALGVRIPIEEKTVYVRSRDNKGEYGPAVELPLP